MDIIDYVREWYVNGNSYGDVKLDVDNLFLTNPYNWSKSKITSAVNLIQDELKAKQLSNTLKTISCKVEDLEPLKKYLIAVEGSTNSLYPIAHWIANIKRSMLNMQGMYQMVVILKGTLQGQGKSTAMDKLCSPLHNYSIDTTLSTLLDEASAPGLARKYIAKVDEFAIGTKGYNNSDLKRLITLGKTSVRTMYTNEVQNYEVKLGIIGTTNIGIEKVYNDPTGMRRFYQINVQDTMDWETINNIDYLALWQGVDETMDYFSLAEEVLYNASRALLDSSHSFISGCVRASDKFVPYHEITRLYHQYCAEQGLKIGDTLKLQQYDSARIYLNGRQCRGYYVEIRLPLPKI